MKTKRTLKLNSSIIGDDQYVEISAFVKSISNGVKIPSNTDLKHEYSKYLLEKHK